MKASNTVKAKDITKRGNVKTTQNPKEEGSPVGPYLLALFIFVVCGSALFEVIMKVQSGTPGGQDWLETQNMQVDMEGRQRYNLNQFFSLFQ